MKQSERFFYTTTICGGDEAIMGDKGRKDKGKREEQKKSKNSLKAKRKLKKDSENSIWQKEDKRQSKR